MPKAVFFMTRLAGQTGLGLIRKLTKKIDFLMSGWMFQQFFSHITGLSGCERGLNVYFTERLCSKYWLVG